jgi:hypothetical protein
MISDPGSDIRQWFFSLHIPQQHMITMLIKSFSGR